MDVIVPDWPALATESNGFDLNRLVEALAALDADADLAGTWPERLWRTLADQGATRWAMPAAARRRRGRPPFARGPLRQGC